MASGFQGRGDFYNSGGINGGGGGDGGGGGGGRSSVINNAQVQYRSQLGGGILLDSSSSSSSAGIVPGSPMIPPRRTDLLSKRSLTELQQQQHQQQAYLMRMVKQRTAQIQNRNSPISPLSPIDSEISSSLRYGYGGQGFGNGNGNRIGIPLVRPPQLINPNINIQSSYLSSQPSLSNLSFSTNNSLQIRQQQQQQQSVVSVLDESKSSDSEEKMRDRLQELEKQLLAEDDDDNNEGDQDEGDAASVITGNEWTETIQNLLSPSPNQQKPLLSPSPTSSTSSSSSSSASQLCLSSSKQTLIDAATAISDGNFESALLNLDRLKPISNIRGDPEQRLTAYMVSALLSRIDPEKNPKSLTELSPTDEMISSRILYEVSPCFKLGFMAANLAILESIKDQSPYDVNLHVLDFDIGQGIQYATLIQALHERKISAIKITTVTDPSKPNQDGLRIVGDRLRMVAAQVGIGLKFNAVSKKISDLILSRDELGIDSDDSLAVNFAFHLHNLPDESVSTENPRDELLRFVKSLKPKVVMLVEQEMNCNTAPFVTRLTESCLYYRSVFDSLDIKLSRDSVERFRVEKWLAKKATNSVACEGKERVERCEVFGKWKARMGMAGFKLNPLSQNVSESLKTILSSISENNPGFTIKEEGGGIWFGWMGRVLTVASAWQ